MEITLGHKYRWHATTKKKKDNNQHSLICSVV